MKRSISKNLRYSEWLDMWLEQERPFIKESTYATYTNIINSHIKPELGQKKISTVTNTDLQNFILKKLNINSTSDQKSLSLKTVKDMIVLVKTTLNSAIEKNIIPVQSFKYKFPPSKGRTYLKTFTISEQKRLFQYLASNITPENSGLLLCLQTGLRLGEICGLQWKDIDFNSQTVSVSRTLQRIYIKENNRPYSKTVITTPKTRNSFRTIPVSSDFLTAVKPLYKSPDCYFITNSEKYMEPYSYRYYYKKILKSLHLNPLSFHSLRHTFATQAIELGIDCKTVSEILGHSSVNTTLNLYIHPKTEYKRKCIKLIYENLAL